jgi:hypothetical protein
MHTFFVKILIISIVSQICWGHGVKPHTPKQIPNDRRKKFGSMLFTSPNPKNFLHHEINFCFYDLISSLRMNCISTYFDNILATKRYMLVPTCLRRHVMSTSQLNRQMAWNLFGKSCLDVPHLRHMASFWQKWNAHSWLCCCKGWSQLNFGHHLYSLSIFANPDILTLRSSRSAWSCRVMPCHAACE